MFNINYFVVLDLTFLLPPHPSCPLCWPISQNQSLELGAVRACVVKIETECEGERDENSDNSQIMTPRTRKMSPMKSSRTYASRFPTRQEPPSDSTSVHDTTVPVVARMKQESAITLRDNNGEARQNLATCWGASRLTSLSLCGGAPSPVCRACACATWNPSLSAITIIIIQIPPVGYSGN